MADHIWSRFRRRHGRGGNSLSRLSVQALELNRMSSIYNMFFLCCLFPYIQILKVNTDVQPNAILASILVLVLVKPKALPLGILACLIPIVGSLFNFIVTGWSFGNLRSVANYSAFFLIATATYHLILRCGDDGLIRLIVRSTYVWLAAALLQFAGLGSIFENFLNLADRDAEARELLSTGRGVYSLATEPTYYGLYCLFLFAILLMYGLRNQFSISIKVAMFFILFQLVFMSQSSMSILMFLFGAFILLSLVNLRVQLIIVGITILAGAAIYFMGPDSRIAILFQLVRDSPMLLFLADASVHARMTHLLFSYLGGFENYLLPQSAETFNSYMATKSNVFEAWFWRIPEMNRIMSGFGGAVYELGVLSFPLFFVWYGGLRRFFKDRLGLQIAFLVIFVAIISTSVPLGLPLVGMIIGWLYAKSEIQSHLASSTSPNNVLSQAWLVTKPQPLQQKYQPAPPSSIHDKSKASVTSWSEFSFGFDINGVSCWEKWLFRQTEAIISALLKGVTNFRSITLTIFNREVSYQ